MSTKPKGSKKCPRDKVFNPKSGRCVNKTGAVARKNKLVPVKCPRGKILNEPTNRCVKKKGRVGLSAIGRAMQLF